MAHDDLLGQQVAYYRARASEYDDWWFRRGRYDRGPRANARWLRDIAAVEQAVAEFAPCGDVVELAAGTGNWTRWLSPVSRSVLAVDASEEVLAVNRAQTRAGNVSYLQADLFGWQPERSFDEAFFGFWLSHVPPTRFDRFWELIRACLQPGGRRSSPTRTIVAATTRRC